MRANEFLIERISSRVFHYTRVTTALKILQSGQFELSHTLGTSWEAQFAPEGYPYFLSTTRTRHGGYHGYLGQDAVLFELDGDFYNRRYPGRAVDYWNNRDPMKDHHKAHEAEDRIFSRDNAIPAAIRVIDLYIAPDADEAARARTRQVIILAKKAGIAVNLFNDQAAWRQRDTRKTADVSQLRGQDPARGYVERRRGGYLKPWMELMQAKTKAQLSKAADSKRYDLQYTYDKQGLAKSLAVDLSNARKPGPDADRNNAIRIIKFMQRNRLTTVDDFVNFLADKWKNIKEGVAEASDLQEIEAIPAQSFAGGKDILDTQRLPAKRHLKPLPGGTDLLYAVEQNRYVQRVSIVEPGMPGITKPHVVAVLNLDTVTYLPNTVQVQTITVDEHYRGRGLAKALYGIVFTVMRKNLLSGASQTPGGRRNWMSLANIPGVEVKGLVRILDLVFDMGPDGDRIIDQIMALGGQFFTKNDRNTYWLFDVVPGKGSLQPAVRNSLSKLYDKNLDTLLLATWSGNQQGVSEAVIPSEQLKSSILYHGTPTKAGYDGISKEGLKLNPELIAQKYKGQEDFAPLPGVYMTKEFGNAVRYSFMSQVSDEQYADYIKQEPYGYVFEFSGKNLSTVTPDEDELGNFLKQLVNTKNLQPNLLKIVQAVPEELKIKLQRPKVDFETIAIAGKWVVNNISDATMQYLLKKYHNVVNYDSMKPIAVWVIPKPNQRFLRDRQGTFNTHNGYNNYAKRFGKRYILSKQNQGVAEGVMSDLDEDRNPVYQLPELTLILDPHFIERMGTRQLNSRVVAQLMSRLKNLTQELSQFEPGQKIWVNSPSLKVKLGMRRQMDRNGKMTYLLKTVVKDPTWDNPDPTVTTENFADGKNPGRKGLSKRVGIPKKATLAQLEKIANSSTGERQRMAQWQLNMRRGKQK